MSIIKVQVKWKKGKYDVEVDTAQPPSLFKMQLFSLTGVPPERQKILVKGGTLKDDGDWTKVGVKANQTLMMMGSAEPTAAEGDAGASNGDTAMEDASKGQVEAESGEKGASDDKGSKPFQPPCGLTNLGNTCYMNATMQCLYSIEELKTALKTYNTTSQLDPTARLTASARDLFRKMELETSGQPSISSAGAGNPSAQKFDLDNEEKEEDGMYEEKSVTPSEFLASLRQSFPQFAQQGAGGLYMQQDAEECYSQVLNALREKLDTSGDKKDVKDLFGIDMETNLVCEESKEEVNEKSTLYTFKCNISQEVNHLHDGFRLSLCEDREKHSQALGRMALFKGVSKINTLPKYLSVQLVRFLYRRDTQSKAKILRRVGFPLQMLDVFEFCSDELKGTLETGRKTWQKMEDEKAELAKKRRTGESGESQESQTSVVIGDSNHTGFYDLHAIITHKGRNADSGHYVSWVKRDGQWVEFDDDDVYPVTDEDIQKLDGGGDWHMAYVCIYKARLV
ncbi:ubiquitin carboxyl-terminal hydrolase [Chloropicon primus]|uniref:Ubiquitin carboxyl-terminal hydrolase n=1 Tax=Chloropicon primus TaxID=1764295 RepID=A0A5B8MYW6_9CHLO|nr:ubiquitin carboxyl-terminal hydrolase [Chloropicon primus]UPR05239.1 ubiquitin carboxyl-terminal hydrolase [Chloropicon primus]|eukprot:QDZ26038.1 ubiquitin carboxyl-terminal hydrolase [Chloropicon primus]